MPSVRKPGLALCLLLAAVVMRAFLPAGMMADTSERGVIAVKLCSSGGVHRIALTGDGSTPADKQYTAPPCAFAGLATPVVPPPPAVPALATRGSERLAYGEVTIVAGVIAGQRLRPPPRGPPQPA